MADRNAIGKELPFFTWEVNRVKIREFVQAIGDENPIYVDKDAAMRAGFTDTPAPLTFATSFVMWTNSLWQSFTIAKMSLERTLHGEETYEYYQEIYPGDIITGRMKICDIETKSGARGGQMDIVRLEILYTNQRNELVVKAGMVLVERRG